MSQADPTPHHHLSNSNPYSPSYGANSIAGLHPQGMQYPAYTERNPQPSHAQHQTPPGHAHPQPFYQPYLAQQPDPNAPLRYPLPPHTEGRLGSGSRHKKEIKRRTKTGCLTCRKRRIKCDEGHPSCRNCQKSKRECLGYDPIFKPQPGPTAIQPGPQQASAMSPTPSGSYPVPLGPQGYTPASYGAPVLEDDSQSTSGRTSIDQSLDGAMDQSNGHHGEISESSQRPPRRGKRLKIGDVLCINGVSPPAPAPPSTLSEELKAEIKKIFSMAYAPGMDKFFETRWFSEKGFNHLMANSVLCDQFAMLTHRFAMNPQDPAYNVQLQVTQSLEAIVVWAMLGLCRQAAALKGDDSSGAEEGRHSAQEAAKRIQMFQELITNGTMSPESAPIQMELRANGTALQGQLKQRETEFWSLVHKFLLQRDETVEASQAMNRALYACRALLDGRENRDVIYSIMVARHFGPKVPGFPDKMRQPDTNSEEDINAKLAVAKRLLEDEADGRGTNQVVLRLAGAAVRSWYVGR